MARADVMAYLHKHDPMAPLDVILRVEVPFPTGEVEKGSTPRERRQIRNSVYQREKQPLLDVLNRSPGVSVVSAMEGTTDLHVKASADALRGALNGWPADAPPLTLFENKSVYAF